MATKSVSRAGNSKFDAQFTFDTNDACLVFKDGANADLFLRLQGPESDSQSVAELAATVAEFADLAEKAAEAEAKKKV